MGIERVTASLLADARKEADEILKTAEWHVMQMIKEEKAKRGALLSATEEEAAKLLKGRERERMAWARLEAKRILSEAREDAIKNVIEDFFSLLNDMRSHKNYPVFLRHCLAEAMNEIGSKDVIAHLVKGDKKHIGSFDGVIVEDLASFGGLIIETADNKVRVDMTVEAIFESRREEFRKKVFEAFFGDGKETKKVEEKQKEKTRKKR